MKQKGVWLTQAQGQTATGLTMGWFRAKVLPKLKSRPVAPGKKKLEYFLTEDVLSDIYKKNHPNDLIEIDDEDISDEQMINDILGDISGDADIPIDPDNIDLNEARRQEVIMRTKYLSQKIEKKKNELFSEWSEKFFLIFSKNFGKFKNTLIDLHLEEKQLNKLNENLDLALENMEIGLTEILQEYMNDDGSLD
jgi:hypothetical protein